MQKHTLREGESGSQRKNQRLQDYTDKKKAEDSQEIKRVASITRGVEEIEATPRVSTSTGTGKSKKTPQPSDAIHLASRRQEKGKKARKMGTGAVFLCQEISKEQPTEEKGRTRAWGYRANRFGKWGRFNKERRWEGNLGDLAAEKSKFSNLGVKHASRKKKTKNAFVIKGRKLRLDRRANHKGVTISVLSSWSKRQMGSSEEAKRIQKHRGERWAGFIEVKIAKSRTNRIAPRA